MTRGKLVADAIIERLYDGHRAALSSRLHRKLYRRICHSMPRYCHRGRGRLLRVFPQL